MGLFDLFRQKNRSSASKAKERLQILIAHERSGRNGPDYLPQMRNELMAVIKKYVPIDDDQVKVQVENGEGYDVLELNITLPDK
ncbi:MAG: Cell division topological specificity factor MinE [uncultured Thiotrichaceae bacterium]|uniref:Cell division topological specificity factor n=1 Tax=uncultured Thiotrichaceae bacterium TaxID=298394 RepID=A0A6S6SU75_9GAMM|nr:MAG: Cell division topological specificity factor MinE [uncultured Thiotrichaceae bacterium]